MNERDRNYWAPVKAAAEQQGELAKTERHADFGMDAAVRHVKRLARRRRRKAARR